MVVLCQKYTDGMYADGISYVTLDFRTVLRQVTGHKGAEEMATALDGADVVIIPAGVPRKPGMTRCVPVSIFLFFSGEQFKCGILRFCAEYFVSESKEVWGALLFQ